MHDGNAGTLIGEKELTTEQTVPENSEKKCGNVYQKKDQVRGDNRSDDRASSLNIVHHYRTSHNMTNCSANELSR